MISKSEIVKQASGYLEILQKTVSNTIAPAPRRQSLDLKMQTREETFRLVRQLFLPGGVMPQVVIFAAVEHGGGSTSVCARTADALSAHVDGLVLVVDADLRSPALHRYFGMESSSSATREELICVPVRQKDREFGGSNLWLLPGARGDANSYSPQYFDRLRSRVSELRKDFTCILIDAPPINAYADAALLGEVADGLVMVLEANYTRREAALRAKETLSTAGVRVLGAVLNKRTFPIPERLYWKL